VPHRQVAERRKFQTVEPEKGRGEVSVGTAIAVPTGLPRAIHKAPAEETGASLVSGTMARSTGHGA
jgi:hypothetical protein